DRRSAVPLEPSRSETAHPEPTRFARVVVIGGAGQVGRLLRALFPGSTEVTSVDVVTSAGDGAPSLVADATRPDAALRAALGAADAVVLALPEGPALAAMSACAPLLPPGALLVETLSVKHAAAELATALAARHALQACGLNPMFAPELGFSGRAVALVPIAPGPRVAALERLIGAAGGRVARVSPDEHDRAASVMQAATHAAVLALGHVVATSGVSPDVLVELAPPPHRTVLALLARISGGVPEVYRDVQAGNPDAPEVRARMSGFLLGLGELASDPDRFARCLAELSAALGEQAGPLRAHCRALFEATPKS
ncbi:prephenate dehydrogenase dimerization domain-containing protein, partial [Actinosynnema sp.]|uniref:prephenate dehydrogenase dimerization domain-containing protein n=1 Tax=Actinosynnema sp. TaxID=1872144 RepID=UPI003F8595FD